MKSTGKAACILPHGVLFRGNAEAVIREKLVRSGYLKGIIGLPANLFFGTGIPACILVLDKENAISRSGIFMIDASNDFTKDGPKNRLREQDIHRIVDTFTKGIDVPRYARWVSRDEIADPKNAYNLNLPRYIDATDSEDLQDIEGHLKGGIPERDIDGLANYWQIMPTVRATLFAPTDRPRYHQLRLPQAEVKHTILDHPEFTAFTTKAATIFTDWRTRTRPKLAAFGEGSHPKALIADIAEDLLESFRAAPLIDAYDIYQHLMTWWNGTMQDDCYLIAGSGWMPGVQPREIVKVKNKEGKLVWPEPGDYKVGQRRFASDLVSATLLVARYFSKEQSQIDKLDARIAELEAEIDERFDDGTGDDGLLSQAVVGDDGKQTITEKSARDSIKKLSGDRSYADEVTALESYLGLLKDLKKVKTSRSEAQKKLDQMIHRKYPALTEDEVKALVIDDKWMARVQGDVQAELDLVSQSLTGRVKQLAKRYATPLPTLEGDVARLAAKVAGHLKAMRLSAGGQVIGRPRLG